MIFKPYQHVARIGTQDTEGIEKGICHIFPKLDGTNASLWYDGEVQAGSRNRHLTPEADNRGFLSHAMSDQRYERLFHRNPDIRLYGEWLVPHTLRTYRDYAWRQFYVFDVTRGGVYLPYEQYTPILSCYDIDYVPLQTILVNPTLDDLKDEVNKNTYLVVEGAGEGIVVKNYNYVNRYGRVIWGKIVRSEFKQKTRPPKIQVGVESAIVDQYVTEALVRKELAKLGDCNPIQPRLLSAVHHAILTEETWNFVKKFKNPTVDFKQLQRLINDRTKEYAPEHF